LKTFVTIFPFAQNVHLIKDVGQIANTIAATKKYNAKLVCYKNSKDYSYLQMEANHLQIEFLIPCGRKFFMEKAILNYIKQHAQNIDVIHFFHLTKETIYYALYFKKYNPKGKIYLKMDVYNQDLEKRVVYSKKSIFNWLHQQKEKIFFKKLDVISVENPLALKLLIKSYPMLYHKALLVTNGVNDDYLKKKFPTIKPYSKKENIILSVGRIGATDKNFEMLLNSFSMINLSDWKLIFVGPIENNFDDKVNLLIAQNPQLKGKIELTGNIENREELYKYYNRSKICCLTSPFESFGITFIESMYFGNYVIGTKGMSSFNYITNNFELGRAVERGDDTELAEFLKSITVDEIKLEVNYTKAQNRVKENFYWSEIIKPLVNKLNENTL